MRFLRQQRPVAIIRWRKSIFAALLSISTVAQADKPNSVVSLNLCTDQLVMQLADHRTIAALSPLSRDKEISYLADKAEHLPQHSGSAEEIIRLQPDLIFAGTFTTRSTNLVLRRFGFRVVEIGIPSSIDDMRAHVLSVAEALGESERGAELLSEMDARLAQLTTHLDHSQRPVAAVYYANGFSAASNSVVGDVLQIAGYRNLSAMVNHISFGRLELETLLRHKPDLIILDNYVDQRYSLAQEILSHPAFGRLMNREIHEHHAATAVIPSRLWICATPAITDAVEILVDDQPLLSDAR